MNAPRRIRTVVVAVPVDNDWLSNDRVAAGSVATRPRFKPSELLPWSDPYIAGLVRKLQDDVRASNGRQSAEAEMPWNEPFEYEFEADDHAGFSIDTDALLKW
jgi:hypothetical protein